MKKLFFLLFILISNYSFSQYGGCKIDIVIALDVSGSNTPTTCLAANEFVVNLVNALDSEMDGSISGSSGSNNIQIGLCTWTTNNASICDNGGPGNNVQVSPMTTNASLLSSIASNSLYNQIIGVDEGGSDFYQCAETMGMQTLSDFANSDLGDRSSSYNYKRYLIIVTDASSSGACSVPLACEPDMLNNVWNVGTNNGNPSLDVETIAVVVRSNLGAPPTGWQQITQCIVQSSYNQYEGNGNTLGDVGIDIALNVCQSEILVDNTCFGDSTSFGFINDGVDSVSWNFGDPLSSNNFSSEFNPTHLFSAPGAYDIELITFSNGALLDSNLIQLQIHDLPNIDLGLDTLMCSGAPLNFNFTNQNYDFLWQDGSTSSVYNIDTEGLYTLAVTDSNNCENTDSINVLFPPDITLQTQNPSCYGFNDGWIELTSNGVLIPYDYNWSNGDSTQNIYNLADGIYDVSISYDSVCPSLDYQITLNEPDSIQMSGFTSNFNGFNVSCYGASDGFIEISPSGGTMPYQYYWSDGSNTEDLYNIQSGAYFLTLIDDNNCVYYDNFFLSEPSNIVSTIFSTNDYNGYDVSCFNSNDGAIELFVNGGISPYNLNWSNGSTFLEVENLFAGLHTVEIEDLNGCTHFDTIVLIEPDTLISEVISLNNFNGYDISCYDFSNGALDLIVNGGVEPYLFNWSNGSELEDISNLSEGTYSVDIIDNNNCNTVNQITLIDPPAYNLDLEISNYNGYNVSCHNNDDGWINLDIQGSVPPYTFSWNNGSSSQNLNQLTDGSYSVFIQDANLCETSISAQLIEPSPLVSQLISQTNYNGYDISCFNFNDGEVLAIASGSVLPYTISWNNDTTLNGFSLTDANAGQQFVEIVDLNGCVKIDSITLIQPSEVSLSITSANNFNGYEISCHGATDGQIDLSVIGGVTPYEYIWNTGYALEDPTNLSAGVYNVFVNDMNACNDSIQITLNEPSPLLQSYLLSDYNGYNISCFNTNDGWIDFDVNGSVPPYSFNWNNGTNQQDNNMLFAGNYSVQIQDLNLCSTSVDISLTQPSSLVSEINSIMDYNGYDISCNGYNDGAIESSVNGSLPPYSLSWNTGQNTDVLTDLTSGTYTLQITDLNNCILTDFIELTEPLALNTSIQSAFDYNGYDISCYNYSDGGVELSINGGIEPYSTLWNNGETLEDLNGLTSGDYSVSILDQNNCPDSNLITLNQPTELVLNFSASDYNGYNISCNGLNDGTINALISGSVPPYTYEWSNGLNTQNLYLLSSANYNLEISDLNNCQIADSLFLTEPNDFFVNLSYASDTCGRGVGSASTSVTPEFNPYSYQWSNGEISSEVNNLYAGQNSVIVTDIYNCQKLFEFDIDDLPNPLADFIIEPQKDSLLFRVNTNLNFIDQSTDSWSFINNWYWDFGDGNYNNTQNATHSYSSIQDFTVTLRIENIHQCMDTIKKTIRVGNFMIHFPNTFSPQGDLINDKFISKGIGIKDFEMTIYSRWGEPIHVTKDMNIGWDGTYQSTGVKCQQGVYVYDVIIRDVFGDIHRITGNVTLID